MTTTEAKTNQWDSQVRYKLPTVLTKGTNYTISMVVKATAAVQIQPIAVYDASTNKDQWGGSNDLQYMSADLTTEFTTVSFETNGNFPYDYLFFNIGKLGGTMTISRLTITNKSNNQTVLDDDISSVSNWSKVSYHDHVSYKYVSDDNTLKVTTSGAQTNVWDWQIRYKLPTALEKEKTYTIEMMAKAASAVHIQPIAAWNASTNKDQWGGTADLQYLGADITKDWSTVEFETNGEFPYDYLYFNIGNVNGDLMISNIKITEKGTSNVVLDNHMDDLTNWTKTQSQLAMSIVSADEEAKTGRKDFVFTGYDDNPDYTLRPIRQLGKDIVYVDDTSKKITLHGVMDTPNTFFNNERWVNVDPAYNNDTSVKNCLDYFETLLSAFVDNRAGAYCDVFRLHLDPKWTNDPNKTATNGGDENDISRFSEERLRTYMNKLYWPIIEKALAKGLYVIMRPPGVCPHDIQVGGEYQKYLKTVWGIVASDERVQKYAGNIMIELANEPVNVFDTDGITNSYSRASVLHDFFQPIVDVIRANGFKGIILSSGATWQQSYQGYETNPITGDNIGYAVHWYPGWYSTKHYKEDVDNQTVIDQFKTNIPVVVSRPIVVTEVDWSPELSPRVVDHVDEYGNTVYKNYGTWATGTTSSFAKNFKAVHDYFGNISMTLTHPYEYVDFDKLFREDGYVTYSFQKNDEPKEACAYTCFQWYKDWKKDHWLAGKKPAAEDKVDELNASAFHKWDGTGADATQLSETIGCNYVLNSPSDMIYGNSSVKSDCYADLSSYSKLYITVTEGAPRLLFNRLVNEGEVPLEIPRDNEYYSVVDNGDGTMTYIVDIKEIVKDDDYAHLNAIKGANWSSAIITHMVLFKGDDDEFYTEAFDFDKFTAVDNATYDKAERSLTGGQGGWTFNNGVNLSGYKYLVITSAQNRKNCSGSVWVRISDGTNTIDGNDSRSANYTMSGKGFWLDNWNNNNILVISMAKLRDGGFDISSLKSLQFGFQNPDVFYLGNVYATNTLPTYKGGDYSRTVSGKDKYGTISLPYDAAFSGCFVYEIVGKSESDIYMKRPTNLMEAGRSYFYLSTPNYTGNTGDHNIIFYKAGKNLEGNPLPSNGLVGTFVNNGIVPNDMYIVNNNELYAVNNVDVRYLANRAYIDINQVPQLNAPTGGAVRMRYYAGEDDTFISDLNHDVEADIVGIYSASGVKQMSLQKGVNIVRMSDNTVKKIIIR